MSGPQRHEKGPTVDEHALEVALDRLLGGEVAGVLKASVLRKAHEEGISDPDRLLQEIENLNPWLGALLRRSATEPRSPDPREGRTQRNTTARKGEK